VGLLRILSSSAFACAVVLLLVGCGTNPTTSTTTSNSSASGLTASPQTGGTGTSPQTEGAGNNPQTEGTGPESPQSAGNGGVSVSLAGLPIGDGSPEGDNLGNNECVRVAVLGKINHPGVELTVTVGVTGPFTKVDSAAAGCPQDNPPCEGTKFTIANDSAGTNCYAGVQYTGPSLSDTSPAASGTLKLDGDVSCQNVDSTTCHKYRDEVLQSGISANGQSSVSISFTGPTTTDGGSGPSDGGSAPSDGGSAPSDSSSL